MKWPPARCGSIALAALLAACAATLPPIPRFVAAELGLRDAVPGPVDFARPFESPLPARVQEGRGRRLVGLNNCYDYLAVRERIVGSDNDADYRVLRLQTVSCQVLALLDAAVPASRTALPADFRGERRAAAYPASLWPAVGDEERRRLAGAASLQAASGQAALRGDDGATLVLEAAGFTVRLTLLARADFDHDGWEDAAFRWEAYARGGSYGDARLLVLSRRDGEPAFRELSVATLLAPRQR
jgi:hypothetical protein